MSSLERRNKPQNHILISLSNNYYNKFNTVFSQASVSYRISLLDKDEVLYPKYMHLIFYNRDIICIIAKLKLIIVGP